MMKKVFLLVFFLLWAASSHAALRVGIHHPTPVQWPLFGNDLTALGTEVLALDLYWGSVEYTPGVWDYRHVDSIKTNAPPGTQILLRLSSRHLPEGDSRYKPGSSNVPADLTPSGPYATFVKNVVSRLNGYIWAVESEWEADCVPKHWDGTATEYATMYSTMVAVMHSVDPSLKGVLGMAEGDSTQTCTQTFDPAVLSWLQTNDPDSLDYMDVHGYTQYPGDNIYTIPSRVAWYRPQLDTYGFQATKIITTEYGGPAPSEFRYMNPTNYDLMEADLNSNPCYLVTDGTIAGGAPHDYEDVFRMFFNGNIGSDLETHLIRIQARQMAQIATFLFAEGADEVYWWKMYRCCNYMCTDPPGIAYHPVYGKRYLYSDYAMPTGTRDPFVKMSQEFDGAESVTRLPDPCLDCYLYRISGNGDKYILWQRRDQFAGENDPKIPASFAIDAETVSAETILADPVAAEVENGQVALLIDDTPVFVEKTGVTASSPPPTPDPPTANGGGGGCIVGSEACAMPDGILVLLPAATLLLWKGGRSRIS